jgi:hypothetical protein
MENMAERPHFPAPVMLKGGRLTLAEIDAARKVGRK